MPLESEFVLHLISVKDIRCHVRPYAWPWPWPWHVWPYSFYCKSPDQTSNHAVKWQVSLVIVNSNINHPPEFTWVCVDKLTHFVTLKGSATIYKERQFHLRSPIAQMLLLTLCSKEISGTNAITPQGRSLWLHTICLYYSSYMNQYSLNKNFCRTPAISVLIP